jgi:AcrR family transcriptional regulator
MNEPAKHPSVLPDKAPTRPKQERAVLTRARVVRAAAEAFAGHGFPNTTIMGVAQLCGMTKGAVYFHYANKEALALAVVDEFYRRLPTIAEAVEGEGFSPLTSVGELLLRTARALRTDVVVQAGARLQIERAMIDSELPMPYQGYTDLIATWLAKAVADGEMSCPTGPATLAMVLVSAFFGAQHISWVLNDRADVEERTLAIIQTVIPTAVRCTGTCRTTGTGPATSAMDNHLHAHATS